MNDIKEQYISALEDYLAGKGEAALEQAYEIGRRAIAQGLGILHMASVHQDALAAVLPRALTPEESAQITEKAAGFFCESLAPFEMTFRGFQESITKLLDLNRELERSENELRKAHDELEIRVQERTAELSKANEALQAEIQERKRAEEILRESEMRYRMLFEHSTDGVLIIDPETASAIEFNEIAHRQLGYTREEFKNLRAFDYEAKETPEEIRAHIEKVLREGRDDFETLHRTKDGKIRNVFITVQAIKLSGQVFFHCIYRDITDRKRAEEERERWTAELARSNTELEQFAYVASHDLQEPLRMISGFTQLLARRYRDRLDENAYEFIDYIVDGATRMQRMIEDLLAYSRVGTRGKPFELISCKDIFDQVIANLKVTIGENNAQVTHDPLPAIMADSTQMTQLFQNLISNAIKFRGEEPPRVHISVKRAGNEWVFSVQDNGIGIAPEFFDRLFQIFQRIHTGREYPGTGIGLAICKKIVERHGGRIWVESEVGRGSTFYFTIPVRSTG